MTEGRSQLVHLHVVEHMHHVDQVKGHVAVRSLLLVRLKRVGGRKLRVWCFSEEKHDLTNSNRLNVLKSIISFHGNAIDMSLSA